MLNAAQWRKFDQVVKGMTFPTHSGRLPTTVSWSLVLCGNIPISRTLLTFLHPDLQKPFAQEGRRAEDMVTYCSGSPLCRLEGRKRHSSGDFAADASKKAPTFNRNPKAIFELRIRLSTCLRTLALRSISMNEVNRAMEDLRQYCRLRLLYNIELVISHHVALHYPEFFRSYGPAYVWWLFAFESYNGLLEEIKTNGKAGGRMELTLIRNWVQRQLLFDLLTSLPPEADASERKLIQRLINGKDRDRGTYLSQDATFQSTDGLGAYDNLLQMTYTYFYCSERNPFG